MDTHTHTGSDTDAPSATRSVDLAITGMTCASCAARIEKRLGKVEGVSASVNFATERARVSAPADVSDEELIAQVEAAGYTARVPAPSTKASRAEAVVHKPRSTPSSCSPRAPASAPPSRSTAAPSARTRPKSCCSSRSNGTAC